MGEISNNHTSVPLSKHQIQAEMKMLPEGFTPNEWDVICQRGKDSFEHAGNHRFRKCIDKNIDKYMKATSRQEKSMIVSKIYTEVLSMASRPHGGFVKKDLLTRRWFQVSEKEAKDKVGQALRDAIKIIRAGGDKKKTLSPSTKKTVKSHMSKVHSDNKTKTQLRDTATSPVEQEEAPLRRESDATGTSESVRLALGMLHTRNSSNGHSSNTHTPLSSFFGNDLLLNESLATEALYDRVVENSTRALLEQQINAAAAANATRYNNTATTGGTNSPDLEGRSMLRSSFEPLDHNTANSSGLQDVERMVNRKRRRPSDLNMALVSWSGALERDDLFHNNVPQEAPSSASDEAGFPKRIRQQGMNPFRLDASAAAGLNLDLLAQPTAGQQDNASSWLDTFGGSLSSSGLQGQLANHLGAAAAGPLFLAAGSLEQQQNRPNMRSGGWDLEPTPIPGQTSNQQQEMHYNSSNV